MDANLPVARRLLIIDDDPLTREVLSMLAQDAGFQVTACEDGEGALQQLGTMHADAVLADLQMPGLRGSALARQLRAAGGAAICLLAMSGSAAVHGAAEGYDGFLLKPFSMEELHAALAPGDDAKINPDDLLNPATLLSLRQTMAPGRLRELYTMCLNDADSRIGTARSACGRRDSQAFRQAAHAIKGSCSMVGATELARLAAAMESDGPPEPGDEVPFTEFMGASARLRRMLDAHLT